MHARSHTVNHICMHTHTNRHNSSKSFEPFFSTKHHKLSTGRETRSQMKLGFYQEQASQANRPRWTGGCDCGVGGVKQHPEQIPFLLLLFSPPDGLEVYVRCQTICHRYIHKNWYLNTSFELSELFSAHCLMATTPIWQLERTMKCEQKTRHPRWTVGD